MKTIKMAVAGITLAVVGTAQADSYNEAHKTCSSFREMAEYVMHKRQYRASLPDLLREFQRISTGQAMAREAFEWHYSTHADVKRSIVRDFGDKHYSSCMRLYADL